MALFKRTPERVLRFFYEERMVREVGDICAQMAKRRPDCLVDAEELTKIAGTPLRGGVVAEPRLPPLRPTEAKRWAVAHQSLFVLDGIGNPHNLGAIARILAFLGFKRLVISDYPEQAGLSAVACRVAEGGFEALDVYRATMLLAILKQLKPDYRMVGTALVPNGLPPESLWDDPRPVVLVLSNEEYGLLCATLDACDAVITLQGRARCNPSMFPPPPRSFACASRPRSRKTPPPRRPAASRRKSPDYGGKPKARPSRDTRQHWEYRWLCRDQTPASIGIAVFSVG